MKSHNPFILIFCMIALSSCSTTISKYFGSTQHIEGFNNHLINEKIPLYLDTPGDIEFEDDKEKIKQRIADEGLVLDGILAYGETDAAPHYAIYVLMNPKTAISPASRLEFVSDTLINRNRYIVYCRNKSTDNIFSFRTDCKNILETIAAHPRN